MATLSKHGSEIARIEKLTKKVAYMADGTILQNSGDGWKLRGKVKPGIDPLEHAQRCVSNYDKLLMDCPALADFRKAFHAEIAPSHRYMVSEVLSALANDPDGVWSEMNDVLLIPIDIDECVNLCRLYEEAGAESKARRQAQKGVAA
jgi:hypothetical protein